MSAAIRSSGEARVASRSRLRAPLPEVARFGAHGDRWVRTHLTELLTPLGTAAFQTLSQVRNAKPTAVDANGKPRKIDSCYAYASNRDVVLLRWPKYYDGDEGGPPR